MLRSIFRFCLAALLLIALYIGFVFLSGNFHTVIAGRLYRSGQPSPEQIAAWHERYGIKTIINLRGANPHKDWYKREQEAARQAGIELVDYQLSARREVTADQLENLLDVLSTAKPPILIHCRDGADRSGFVSAVYIAGVAKGSELLAESQLSFLFGHIPLWFIPYYAMDRSLEKAEPRLRFPGS
jgi:uncharacterized protein (TIGR01244 family)